MSKRRASEIWKEIKPFAVRDLVKPDNKTTSGVSANGLYFYDIDNVSSHQLPSITTGDYNTVYGIGAGVGIASGSYNTIIGNQAGYNNDAYNNVFIGYSAGLDNVDGAGNVFIGTYAGENSTHGDNTFVGHHSGLSTTTGNFNAFFGGKSGYGTDTGTGNTALGAYAGYSIGSGYANTFVGTSAGRNTVDVDANTFVGTDCGKDNTSGEYNVFMGWGTGESNTTGNSNTCIGSVAGYLNSTGSGNVFLGYRAGQSETGSNKLYIENSNSATPLIYGEFDNDIVKINGSLTATNLTVTPVWKSWDIRPDAVKLPITNPPVEDTIDAFSFDRFDRETEESVYYVWEVPADYYAGAGSVKGRFEFVVENPPTSGGTNVAENVRMGFEYKKISDGAVFDFDAGTSSGYIDETIAVDETAWIIHQTADGTCTTTGWAVGDTILFRFYRDATAAEDTYDNEASAADNDVWVFGFRIKYLVDKIGADQ